MDADTGLSFYEGDTNKEAIKYLSPIQILSTVANEIEDQNTLLAMGPDGNEDKVRQEIARRKADAQNLRILIGGISGWGYLDGVTMSAEAFQQLVAKYPLLRQLSVRSEELRAPSLSLRHLQEGKAVLSDMIIPKDDGTDKNKLTENTGVHTDDDILRLRYKVMPDPMNPAILTSAGHEVISVRLNRADTDSKGMPIHVLTQIALSVEAPVESPQTTTEYKSPAKLIVDAPAPDAPPPDPQADVMRQLEGLMAA